MSEVTTGSNPVVQNFLNVLLKASGYPDGLREMPCRVVIDINVFDVVTMYVQTYPSEDALKAALEVEAPCCRVLEVVEPGKDVRYG